jgi:hypothetical protein
MLRSERTFHEGETMTIDLQTALRLFQEANDFDLGKSNISMESEIRSLAKDNYHRTTVVELLLVCKEIFRVIAVNCMSFSGDHK